MGMDFADEFRRLKIRTNADTPADAQRAIGFGAEGIGLFRIEHMFYGEGSDEPLFKLRKMIMSSDEAERRAALDETGKPGIKVIKKKKKRKVLERKKQDTKKQKT